MQTKKTVVEMLFVCLFVVFVVVVFYVCFGFVWYDLFSCLLLLLVLVFV